MFYLRLNIVLVCDIVQDCVTCCAKFCDIFNISWQPFFSRLQQGTFPFQSEYADQTGTLTNRCSSTLYEFSISMIKLVSLEQVGLCRGEEDIAKEQNKRRFNHTTW